MKPTILIGSGKSRIFLKSVNHIRVNDGDDNHLRSILVGLQFAIVYFPSEILTMVLLPFIRSILMSVYEVLFNLIFVLQGAVSAVISGFAGHLEATHTTEEVEIEIINE